MDLSLSTFGARARRAKRRPEKDDKPRVHRCVRREYTALNPEKYTENNCKPDDVEYNWRGNVTATLRYLSVKPSGFKRGF